MLGGNGIFSGNWVKIVIGFVVVLLAAAGVTVPMCLMDNTNETQDIAIGDINTWRADFYDVEWPAYLLVFGTLSDDFGTHLLAYTDYTELNDQNIANINEDIAVLNAWVTAFYNDDAEALGEWQEFMAVWTGFYNTGYDDKAVALGEFQRVKEALWAAIAELQARPPVIIQVTE